MNAAQDPRAAYPQSTPPPDRTAYDPAMGEVPASWRKTPYALPEDPRRKSPALAAILSFMPGLGQVYVGYYQQGFIHIGVVATIIVVIANARYGTIFHDLIPLLGLFLGFFWLYNIIDASRRATFYNQALAGLGPVDIPEDMKLPKGGSLAGGVVLIGVGLLLFANTALGMSLDWLEQWWPMALVLLGLYLVYGHLVTRRKTEGAPARPESNIEQR